MKFDQSHLALMASRVSTTSAMNPSLMLCLMVCPLAFGISGSLFHFDLQIPGAIFALIGCYPLAITGWQLVHFTKNDAGRLQREQHIERMAEISNTLAVKDGENVRQLPLTPDLADNPTIEG